MFVPISLQLARGLRHKTVLPIFNCQNLEIALTVLEVSERLKTGLMLCVDIQGYGSKKNWNYLELLSYYAQKSNSPVSIILMNGTEEEYGVVESYLYSGMSILKIEDEGAYYVVDNSNNRVALYHKQEGRLSKEVYHSLDKNHKAYKLPQIIEIGHLNSASFKDLSKVGVVAYVLNDELNMAYTAGLRSALRDRSRSDPEYFKSRSLLAVSKLAQSYLTNFQYK